MIEKVFLDTTTEFYIPSWLWIIIGAGAVIAFFLIILILATSIKINRRKKNKTNLIRINEKDLKHFKYKNIKNTADLKKYQKACNDFFDHYTKKDDDHVYCEDDDWEDI